MGRHGQCVTTGAVTETPPGERAGSGLRVPFLVAAFAGQSLDHAAQINDGQIGAGQHGPSLDRATSDPLASSVQPTRIWSRLYAYVPYFA